MDASVFDIAVTADGRGSRVGVAGELDLVMADDLRRALQGEMLRGRSVTLDLAHVSFVDATGLSAILHTVQATHRHGWTFRVASSLSAAAQRTLLAAGVLNLLPLVDEA